MAVARVVVATLGVAVVAMSALLDDPSVAGEIFPLVVVHVEAVVGMALHVLGV